MQLTPFSIVDIALYYLHVRLLKQHRGHGKFCIITRGVNWAATFNYGSLCYCHCKQNRKLVPVIGPSLARHWPVTGLSDLRHYFDL